MVCIKESILTTKEKFGEMQNLLLLDNNVLASPKFPAIINEIKELGFSNGAKYKEPNWLEIARVNLINGINNKAYIRKIVSIGQETLNKIKGPDKQDLYNVLFEKGMLSYYSATKKAALEIVPVLAPMYEKVRNKSYKGRYVDFNQGVDARLFTEEKAKILSQIPIRPLRIAFDSIEYKDQYVEALLLANKYGIKHFSNYLLYNFEDKPKDLYKRLKLNVELCDEYGLDIYSFPMKYHPIFGDYHLNRDFIGKHWNRKYIRAVQVILNATKGKIGRGRSFFEKAFGSTEKEFSDLLFMPEVYLFYRFHFENNGQTQLWFDDFNKLDNAELKIAKEVIKTNDFKNINLRKFNKNVKNVLQHYLIDRNEISVEETSLTEFETFLE
jgi:hypothetical protein